MYVPKTSKNERNFFHKLFSLLKKWRTNKKRHFGSFAPDKTGTKKSQKFNKKLVGKHVFGANDPKWEKIVFENLNISFITFQQVIRPVRVYIHHLRVTY